MYALKLFVVTSLALFGSSCDGDESLSIKGYVPKKTTLAELQKDYPLGLHCFKDFRGRKFECDLHSASVTFAKRPAAIAFMIDPDAQVVSRISVWFDSSESETIKNALFLKYGKPDEADEKQECGLFACISDNSEAYTNHTYNWSKKSLSMTMQSNINREKGRIDLFANAVDDL